jgi:hypothetical protein
MTQRDYKVDLPFTIPSWAIDSVVLMLVGNGLWYKLTPELADKINHAHDQRSDLVITREDLDALPDAVWSELEAAAVGML